MPSGSARAPIADKSSKHAGTPLRGVRERVGPGGTNDGRLGEPSLPAETSFEIPYAAAGSFSSLSNQFFFRNQLVTSSTATEIHSARVSRKTK